MLILLKSSGALMKYVEWINKKNKILNKGHMNFTEAHFFDIYSNERWTLYKTAALFRIY